MKHAVWEKRTGPFLFPWRSLEKVHVQRQYTHTSLKTSFHVRAAVSSSCKKNNFVLQILHITSPSETSKKMTRTKINNVALSRFQRHDNEVVVVGKKLDLDFTYVSLMTLTLPFFSLAHLFPVSFLSLSPYLVLSSSILLVDWWKLSNRLLPCAVPLHATNWHPCARVSATVHSNGQSSLHPPLSGAVR